MISGRGSRCFPKCLGTRTLYLGQRGKPTRFLESAKGSFAESRGQTPGSLASGSRRQGLWRLVLESEKDSCLSGETDFVEAFTPSFDPKAQYINRGAGLAPKAHQETPSRVAAILSPLVYPPSSFCSAWQSRAEIVLHHQPSPRRRAAGTHLLARCDQQIVMVSWPWTLDVVDNGITSLGE